jgi:deoxyadenosine/deoxycytidine kinase
MIKSEYNCKLILEEFANNPFLPMFYENPERFAFTVELFFMTERYKQLQKELTLDLFYDFTIADYSFTKTILFARQNLKEDEFRLFQKLFGVLAANFPNPDLLVYLHRSTTELQKNISQRGRNYEKMISNSYLDKVQNGYFEYFRNILSFPILIIDVSNIDFVNNIRHYEEIKRLMSRQYMPGVHRVLLM